MRAAKPKCSNIQQAHRAQSNSKSCRPHKDQASCELPLILTTYDKSKWKDIVLHLRLVWKVGPAEALQMRTHANMLRALQPDSIISHPASALT